jgi:tetratricopeptide (TPR) repeat protein
MHEAAVPREAATCGTCGAEVGGRQRFCHECGAALSERSEGEHRVVSVLHCRQARGPASSDPEERLREVTSMWAPTVEQVERFGGAVLRLDAEAFVAVFGVPTAWEDHARRAALAGMEAVREGLAAGIGTGAVLAASDRRGPVLVGACVDTATRLAARAAPGQLLVDAMTEEALRGYITSEPAEGVQGAVRVVGEGGRHGRLDRPDRPLTHFVGRSRQLTALAELLDEARAGRGQVVGVAAEAGMGKSRLVAHFLARAAGVTHLEGRCLSYATTIPFAAIADVVRAAAGRTSSRGDGLVGDLETLTVGLGLDPAQHVPYLVALTGSSVGTEGLRDRSPEAVREATFDSVVALLTALAERSPVALLIEDMHWIDPVSQDVLMRLVGALPGRRILLLATYRPGYRAPWLDVSYATQLALPRLGEAESLELVRSIVGARGGDDAEFAPVVARADGNPFFLEELAQGLLAGAIDPAAVPTTVHDVLLARIDRLGSDARALLRTAAVLGREFRTGVLAELWDGDDAAPLLDELRRAEFVYSERGARGEVHVFKHALTHEVAYGALLSDRRAALHRRAGDALERLNAGRTGEVADVLGYHFSQAGDHARAVGYLGEAAERALQGYSNASAAEALETALRHVREAGSPALTAEAPRLVFRLAFTLYLLGRFRDALTLLESLPELHPIDEAIRGEHLFWLAYFHAHLGNSEEAHDNARRAIAEAVRRDDRFTAGRAYYVLTREDFWLGRYAQGVGHGAEAVALLEGDEAWWWWLGHASAWKGLCHYNRGEFPEALAACGRMNAIGQSRGDPRLTSYSDWNLGWIEATRGNAALGVAHCSRSLQRSPDPLNSAYSTWALGFALRESGDHAAAIDHLERAVVTFREVGYLRLVGWLGGWLADAYLWAGRPDDARRTAAWALEVSGAVRYPWAIAVGTRALGRLAEADGRLTDAVQNLLDALDRFERIDSAFDAAVTRMDLARVRLSRGEDAEAHEILGTAIRALHGMDAPVYLERARDMADGKTSLQARPTTRGSLTFHGVAEPVVERDGAQLPMGRLARSLLAVLLAQGSPVHRDRLAGWVAGDLDEAVTALHTALADDGASRLQVRGPTVALERRPGDAWDVDGLIERADAAVDGDGERLRHELAGLLTMTDAEWAAGLRARLTGAWTEVTARVAADRQADGDPGKAAVLYREIVSRVPEDERWHRELMRAHADAGDLAEALRAYHACRSVLRERQGRDPDAETDALYLELVRRS